MLRVATSNFAKRTILSSSRGYVLGVMKDNGRKNLDETDKKARQTPLAICTQIYVDPFAVELLDGKS
jgi:hypothetical protein